MIEKIDHIGVAVKDLDAVIKFYEQTLGLKVTEKMDRGLSRGAFIKIGEVDVELLENKDPNSAIARHIEKRGEGIHHIGLQVKRIEEGWKNWERKGFLLLMRSRDRVPADPVLPSCTPKALTVSYWN